MVSLGFGWEGRIIGGVEVVVVVVNYRLRPMCRSCTCSEKCQWPVDGLHRPYPVPCDGAKSMSR